ncbi:cytochrome c [Arenicella chitinivorans]|uniref:Cytochrome c n=1 Tax=Arenicella chitinivorans TaxID=1329800 RepID=A0A918RUY3_9GAMM|nr:c-type cytochrome [Arenicella chitinivorans]GHA10229.1 cytochrome c [Arenicella chitinivorans]
MLKKLLAIAGISLSGMAMTTMALAAGDAEAGKAKSAVCAACHGAAGVSSLPINPNLAAQVPGYISAQLKAFKSGERQNAIMAGQVAALTEEDMADLDAYYASLPASTEVSLTEEDIEMAVAGEKLYRGGFAERGISACMGCHGPSGHGIPIHYPRVAGQHKGYLEQQLLAFKKGERVGHAGIMKSVAFSLSEQQIKELSAYMAGLR